MSPVRRSGGRLPWSSMIRLRRGAFHPTGSRPGSVGISVRDDSISGSLAALAGPKPEDAWHRLVEWGPDVLPDVRGAYDMAKETGFRCLLIGIMAELRDGDSI